MTRYVISGNGKLTVLYDSHFVLRELYYPLAVDNHLHQGRTGLWVDGKFSWFDNLDVKTNYVRDSLSSSVDPKSYYKYKFNIKPHIFSS